MKTVPADSEILAPEDLAVPVIDGVPLFEMLEDRYPGVDIGLVAPPSRHWLGQPAYGEEGRAVILDGTCGVAGCCGVMACITVSETIVGWSDFVAWGRPPLPDALHFDFDRTAYETAISAVSTLSASEWIFDLGDCY